MERFFDNCPGFLKRNTCRCPKPCSCLQDIEIFVFHFILFQLWFLQVFGLQGHHMPNLRKKITSIALTAPLKVCKFFPTSNQESSFKTKTRSKQRTGSEWIPLTPPGAGAARPTTGPGQGKHLSTHGSRSALDQVLRCKRWQRQTKLFQATYC